MRTGRGRGPRRGTVSQWATIRRRIADEAQLLEADRRIQTEVAPFQLGFVRRTTARGADGRWLVETLWSSDVDVVAAAEEDGPAVDALRVCVDPGSVELVRWTTLD